MSWMMLLQHGTQLIHGRLKTSPNTSIPAHKVGIQRCLGARLCIAKAVPNHLRTKLYKSAAVSEAEGAL